MKKANKKKLAKKKMTPKKKLTKKKAAPKKAQMSAKAAGKKTTSRETAASPKKHVRQKSRGLAVEEFVPEGVRTGKRSGELSGDLQGLSNIEDADSESVAELLEEGNAFEADVVKGVEDAPDADKGPVRTHEVPEDDVPDEYKHQE
jgi:hypothetical protein